VLLGLQAAWLLFFFAAVAVLVIGWFLAFGPDPEARGESGAPWGLLYVGGLIASAVLHALASYGLWSAERLVRAPWRQLVLAGGAVEATIGVVSIVFTADLEPDNELGVVPWILMHGFAVLIGVGAILVAQAEHRAATADVPQPEPDVIAHN
jgi:hypothetical protein